MAAKLPFLFCKKTQKRSVVALAGKGWGLLPLGKEPVRLITPSSHLRLRRLDLPDGQLLLLLNGG